MYCIVGLTIENAITIFNQELWCQVVYMKYMNKVKLSHSFQLSMRVDKIGVRNSWSIPKSKAIHRTCIIDPVNFKLIDKLTTIIVL